MMGEDLRALLERIVAGEATEACVERARELARHDARLPEGLREEVLLEDIEDEAGALLALLGFDPFDGLLGDALLDEAGFDIAGDVLAAIGSPEALPVAEAVVEEAGPAPAMDVPDDGWAPIADVLRQRLADEAHGVDVSAAVLAAVGGTATLPIRDAVTAEAGQADVAVAVARELGLTELALGAAIRAEAGEVDVREAVMAEVGRDWLCGLLDGQLPAEQHRAAAQRLMRDPSLGREMTALAEVGPRLREALHETAGEVQVWPAVARQIGLADPEEVPGWQADVLVGALRAEAGEVDVRDAVMRRIHRPSNVAEPVEIPAAANESGWRTAVPALVLVAAAAMLFVVFGNAPVGGTSNDAAAPLQFASAGEVTIEDLSYADDVIVHVMPAEGDAPLIVWVDEETTL